MDGFIGPSRSLTFGFAASVLLHGAGIAALARYSEEFVRAVQLAAAPAPRPDHAPEDPEHQLVLGIESSPHKTDTWLGFADPTEHKAPRATVEQAAMDPAPGAGGDAPEASAVPVPRPPEPQAPSPPPRPPPASDNPPRTPPADQVSPPAPAAPPTPALATPAPGSLADDPDPVPAAPAPSQAVTPAEVESPNPQPTPQPTPAPEPQPAPQPSTSPAPAQDPPQPEAPDQQQPAPAVPAPPVAQGAAKAGENAAEKSDRQSTPSSLKDTIEVVPGRPAAAQGLEIRTVRPRWTDTTKIIAVPRNPVVRVTFSRSGKVTSAVFAPNSSTGWRDVDEPLLDAIYRWTAKGQALRDLPPTRDAGLTVQFKIMLR